MLERVIEAHDPEHDTPSGPAVTWADIQIVDAVTKIDYRLTSVVQMVEPMISLLDAELEKYRALNARMEEVLDAMDRTNERLAGLEYSRKMAGDAAEVQLQNMKLIADALQGLAENIQNLNSRVSEMESAVGLVEKMNDSLDAIERRIWESESEG